MPPVSVGIVGAGMGGLAAAIALRRGGVKVTILESTTELGEIGAGIHMFSNISKYLIRWGVDEIIGEASNMRLMPGDNERVIIVPITWLFANRSSEQGTQLSIALAVHCLTAV